MPSVNRPALVISIVAALAVGACSTGPYGDVLTISGSALGREADVLRAQVSRFGALHPDLTIDIRPTPDSADERHQLFVQWLNAHAAEPDVLQLDVVWTAEFAAAGWIRDLAALEPELPDFFPATVAAVRWNERAYAIPWFVDVGMLYWRTDLMEAPPRTFDELGRQASQARAAGLVPYGFVWQGARYEGLVTVFLEYLEGFGGRILDDRGRVVVDSDAAVRALTEMRNELTPERVVPSSVLTWQEEQVRFTFQNGQAAFMRNWPYAASLLADAGQSDVAGRFAVAGMPSGDGGRPGAALGGSELAVNAFSSHPAEAEALVRFLTAPEQMLERARLLGQLPARRSLYVDREEMRGLPIDPLTARTIVEHAVPRPVTPVYAELSEILQIHLHRVLSGQQEPGDGLREAASAIRNLLTRTGLVAS
jgi:multiple sugar transport system substrate-binding protein